jgi:hypothetical protein
MSFSRVENNRDPIDHGKIWHLTHLIHESRAKSADIVPSLILGPSALGGSALRGQILSPKDFESARILYPPIICE